MLVFGFGPASAISPKVRASIDRMTRVAFALIALIFVRDLQLCRSPHLTLRGHRHNDDGMLLSILGALSA